MRVILISMVLSGVLAVIRVAARGPVPDPTMSSAPDFVDLVGLHDGVPDSFGNFRVTIRDALGNPLASVPVMVDFSGCPDIGPSAEQPYPGLTVDCGTKIVSAITDAAGVAHFDIVGSLLDPSLSGSAACAVIRAGTDPVVIKSVRVTTLDMVGENGVDCLDQGQVSSDVLNGLLHYRPRSDYSHNGSNNFEDLGIIQQITNRGSSSETGARCDGRPVSPVRAEQGGVDVAWSQCASSGGSSLMTYDCASSQSHRLVFSVVAPPGVSTLYGYEAEMVITSRDPGTPLPAFWRYDSCSTGSVVASSSNCPRVSSGLSMYVTYPYLGPFAEKIRVYGCTTGSGTALNAGQEYALFDLIVPDDGSCTGCDQPAQVELRSVRLHQSGAPPLIVDVRATSNHAYWQETWTDVRSITGSRPLSLARAPSSPAELIVDLTLPVPAPASLEVFDAAGRRLMSRSLVSLEAGPHRLNLATPGQLPAGSYFVRLRQGAIARSLTVPVLR